MFKNKNINLKLRKKYKKYICKTENKIYSDDEDFEFDLKKKLKFISNCLHIIRYI